MHFEPEAALPPADIILWGREGLAHAGREGYPFPMGMDLRNGVQRPSPEQLSEMEGLLRAMATLDAKRCKAGRFTAKVNTFDGEREYTCYAV